MRSLREPSQTKEEVLQALAEELKAGGTYVSIEDKPHHLWLREDGRAWIKYSPQVTHCAYDFTNFDELRQMLATFGIK